MIRRPPRSTRTDTRFPYTTLFRSLTDPYAIGNAAPSNRIATTFSVPARGCPVQTVVVQKAASRLGETQTGWIDDISLTPIGVETADAAPSHQAASATRSEERRVG